MSSVHCLLNYKHWDLNDINCLLEKDASSVNMLNSYGLSPLHRVLKDEKFSIDIVKCLLHYGANPNGISDGNSSPVFISLRHKRGKEVLRVLFDAGAQVGRIYNPAGHSPLCIALCHDPETDLIQMLVDAGCSLKNCSSHISALHCAMSCSGSKLSADVCKLLLREFASFLLQDGRQRRSFLCHALTWDAEPEAIKLLLDAGCSLHACQDHYSAVGCAASQPGILKMGTVQLLLKAGAKVGYVSKQSSDIYQNILMHKVLETSNCDIDTIKLLYDCDKEVFPHGWPTYGLLHSAVKNSHCQPEILQFLIDKGANAAELDFNFTPLFRAVENDNCHHNAVKVLLRNGCPPNRPCGMRHATALKLAFDKGRELNVIEELLKGGARLAAAEDISIIFKKALERYDSNQSQENINYVKTLLKYAYLENPKFDFKVLALGRKYCSLFSHLNSVCLHEIKILQSTNIYQFISRYSDYKPKAKGNQLLKISSSNTFSVYFDAICNTYGRTAMEMRIQVQPIYCIKNGSNSRACKVILNYDIVRKIAGLLVDEDLFSLLVALYNPDKPTYYGNKKKPNTKRRAEVPTEPRKRLRLRR